jgi:hypothetical protein
MLTQACAAWQWHEYLVSIVPHGTRVVLVSLDETSISMCQERTRGNVYFGKGPRKNTLGKLRGAPSSKGKRVCMTHIGLVCNDSSLQPYLPQVLLVNKKTLPLHMVEAIRAELLPNVEVWRLNSSWATATVIRKLLRRLSGIIAEHAPNAKVIVQMDAYPAHLHESVIKECFDLKMWPLIIPSKLTWLLQVLDTHVFSKYKSYIRKVVAKARSQEPNGVLTLVSWIAAVCAAIRGVLHANKWEGAFSSNGFPYSHADLGRSIKMQMSKLPEHISSNRPSLEMLTHVVPKRRERLCAHLLPQVIPSKRVLSKSSCRVLVASGLGSSIAPRP